VSGVISVLSDGRKRLLALELCGGKSFAAWKGASTISSHVDCGRRCSASSMAMLGCGAP